MLFKQIEIYFTIYRKTVSEVILVLRISNPTNNVQQTW